MSILNADHANLHVIVLAAGKGTRMKSATPKVLHPILGRSLLGHVLDVVSHLKPHSISVVVGHESEQIQKTLGNPRGLQWIEQKERLGTAHAVLQCKEACSTTVCDNVLLVCGDTPLLRGKTLNNLLVMHQQKDADISVLSATQANPFGYGRIVREPSANELKYIIEEKDANAKQRLITEVSSGIYCVKRSVLFPLLERVDNNNAQQEYYLPDIIPLAVSDGLRVQAVIMTDAKEMLGVNNRTQLVNTEDIMRMRIIKDWQYSGVTIQQPATVRIEFGVHIGNDSVIAPGCILLGNTRIGYGCNIGPYSVIQDCYLDDGVQVRAFSHLEKANVGANCVLGPYARLRPDAKLDENVHIGNFVEIKKSVIGQGSKVNHLSYIGDTNMGRNCNIGAGSITCNYDGANKHKTTIGDGVFLGSDTKLIAPVSIGNNSTIGAGSIITKSVAENGLTLSARPEQRHIAQWKRPEKEHDIQKNSEDKK
ncbi:MAG: bifunctional UDP-N-acetylglucosamine diphosphorylase/glucosamine-1-phosphate N-acetyltransferase GlmU [Mariprofundales bacterium]